MSAPARQRVFHPEDAATRRSRAEAYDELRTEIIRRQSERKDKRFGKNLLRGLLYGAILALLAYLLFGIGAQPVFPLL